MRLSTRIALVTGSVLVLGGTTIGWSTALITRNDSISDVDAALVDSLASTSPDDPFGIVEIAQRSPYHLAASLVFDDSAPIPLVSQFSRDGISLMPELTTADIVAAQESPRSKSTRGGLVRVATTSLGDGGWLAIASSVESIESRYRSTLALALVASAAIALLLALGVAWVIGRQFKPLGDLLDSAREIATGTYVRKPIRRRAPREISELGESLDLMIAELSTAMENRIDSERRMREFLGDTAHELRTPLTVIRGYVEILQRETIVEPDVRDRALDRLDSESQRMTRLLNDLLLLAQLNEAPNEPVQSVDLCDILRTHLDDLRSRDPERAISFMAPGSLVIQGRPDLLERLMANVLANVQRHTPPTAPVEITASISHDTATVTIDDGGSGMSTEMLERANEGLVRFASERNRSAGGSGLGLPIMHSIVRQHRGTLEFSRSPLGGVRVTITLATK